MKQVNILVVATQPHMPDVRGVALQQTLQDDLHLRVDEVRTASLYTIHAPLTSADLEEARQVLFTDAVVQESFWSKRPPMTCDWIVQVGLLPGVTDNVGRTAARALEDIADQPFQGEVYTSSLYLLRGVLARQDVKTYSPRCPGESPIQQWRITAAADWQDRPEAFLSPPVAGIDKSPEVHTISLERDDQALVHLSQEGLWSLSMPEMHVIQAYFRDAQRQQQRQAYGLVAEPTDVEMEALAQTWSEHCKHKNLSALFSIATSMGARRSSAVSLKALSYGLRRKSASGSTGWSRCSMTTLA